MRRFNSPRAARDAISSWQERNCCLSSWVLSLTILKPFWNWVPDLSSLYSKDFASYLLVQTSFNGRVLSGRGFPILINLTFNGRKFPSGSKILEIVDLSCEVRLAKKEDVDSDTPWAITLEEQRSRSKSSCKTRLVIADGLVEGLFSSRLLIFNFNVPISSFNIAFYFLSSLVCLEIFNISFSNILYITH